MERRYRKLSRDEIGFDVGRNIGFVVEHALCHGCGTCEAVCPEDAIEMRYEGDKGIYLPHIWEQRCRDCSLCVQACSGFELDLTVRNGEELGLNHHPLIGPYANIYRAYTTDEEKRHRAAAGGMITEIVNYLISSRAVDGAIVTRMREDDPLKADGYIARNSDALIASQKSKYCPIPLNRILKDLIRRKSGEKLAFVGLPHHVHGLRLLKRLFPHMNDVVPYVISCFTAHVPSQRATEFILYKREIKPSEVGRIEYRGGGNPGRMRIVTKDGSVHLIPHLHWTYYGHSFSLFFYPVREWLYFDKLSEWADFSCGDNWMRGLMEQKGASTVVTRSKAADNVMQELIASGRVKASPMTAENLVRDQALRTKLNIYSRLKVWKWLGRKVPVYNREFEKIGGQLIRTLRFATYVFLCEHKVPFVIMDIIIRADYYRRRTDYYLREIPTRFLRRAQVLARIGIGAFRPCKHYEVTWKGKYKVVLIGGYGYMDIGDEAMPHAIRLNLRKALGDDLELVMLSHNPECTAEIHGEKSRRDFSNISHGPASSLKRKIFTMFMSCFLLASVFLEKRGIRLRLWSSAREALDEIGSADVILNVGGGNINSIIPSEFYKKCTTYLIASMLRTPVFLSGQTMGPFYGWFDRFYARFCLNKVRMISFRDKNISHNRLCEIGVTEPVMFDSADDAITLRGIPPKTAQALLEQETGVAYERLKEKLLIFLNLKASLSFFKGKGRDGSLRNEIALMAEIGDALIRTYGCTIVFCSTDFSDNADDRICHQEVYKRMKQTRNVHQLRRKYSDEELIGVIGCADVAVGGRYHFNVFAASRFVPFLGISSGVYQRTKLQGLASLCDLPQCYVDLDMECARFEEVWPSVARVIKQREEIHAQLKERLPRLHAQSLKVVNEVVRELKKLDSAEGQAC